MYLELKKVYERNISKRQNKARLVVCSKDKISLNRSFGVWIVCVIRLKVFERHFFRAFHSGKFRN